MRMKKYLLRLFALMMLSFATPALWAQVTTSAINGTVTDPVSKETLVGASVVAKHLPTGTTYGAITNAKGNYSIVGMRPGGPYTITVSYIGYQKASLTNVTLALGETETLNVTLQSDTHQLSAVSVTGSRGSRFNAQKTGAGTSFSRRNIERVPSVSRSIMDIANLTPQSNGQGSFAGASNRFNSFQIDGAVNNDVFGLGASSSKNAISLEAIDALQIVIAPFDVRQSGFTGGGMNAITKSGTNTFRGSVYDYYYNQDFYGTTAGKNVKNRKKLDKQYENTVGFTLGGPIVKDKLFFFANGEYVKGVRPTTYTPGDGSIVTKEIADKVDAKLKELGYDAGGYAARDIPSETFKGLLRLDWNINAKHRLTLRYSHINDKPYFFSNSPTQLRFFNNGYFRKSVTNTIVAELNSKLNEHLSNEVRVSYSGIRDRNAYYGARFPFIRINGLIATDPTKPTQTSRYTILAGVDNNRGANELDQDIYSLTDNLTLSLGNHTLTFGTHNELFRMRNLYLTNYFGNYTYGSSRKDGLQDFLNIGTPAEVAPESYGYSGVNTQFTGGNNAWAPSFRAGQIGLYAQDDWKVTDRFRLTYGLRIDMPFFLDRPTANTAFNESDVAKEYGITNNYLPPLRPLFSPRVGFRYQLDEARKYTLRGGTGIFTGRVPFVWISNSFTNSGVEYLRTSTTAQKTPSLRFNPDVDNQYRPAGISEVDIVGKNFRYPQVWRTNLALDATLPWGIRATLEGMYSKNINSVRFQNLILKRNGQLDHGNGQVRPVYQLDPALSAKYTNLILLTSNSRGYSYNISGTLAKDFGKGFDASISYTYGTSRASNDGGTSSQAVSIWAYNSSIDINGEEVYHSNYDMRHRIIGQLNYRVEYAKHFATTIGLVYNGYSGDRYSMTYFGDANGDGGTMPGTLSNDLAYIPTREEVQNGYFTANIRKNKGESDADFALRQKSANEAMAQSFEEFMNSSSDLNDYRGRIAPRNIFLMKFVHKFDLHFAQDFFLKVGGRRHTFQLNADIINVGNLLNRGWGMTPSIQYNNISPITINTSGATPTYSFNKPNAGNEPWTYSDLGSRWRAQVGIKYTF